MLTESMFITALTYNQSPTLQLLLVSQSDSEPFMIQRSMCATFLGSLRAGPRGRRLQQMSMLLMTWGAQSVCSKNITCESFNLQCLKTQGRLS